MSRNLASIILKKENNDIKSDKYRTLKSAAEGAFSLRSKDNFPPTPSPSDEAIYAQGTRPHAQRTFVIFTNQA